METEQLIAALIFAILAIFLPCVAYFWMKQMYCLNDDYEKEETTGNFSKINALDLMEIVVASTQSSDGDGVETCLTSSYSKDVEAQSAAYPHEHRQVAEVAEPKEKRAIHKTQRQQQRQPHQHQHPPGINLKPTSPRNQSEARKDINIKKCDKVRNERVDVHVCISETCEICSPRKGGIKFVQAQTLETNEMVRKLRNAGSTRWWELGGSFYDLYQQAQIRAAEKKLGASGNNDKDIRPAGDDSIRGNFSKKCMQSEKKKKSAFKMVSSYGVEHL